MLDQDGAMDEALNADGSQPEFDFDDIEAPVQPKASPAPPATVTEAATPVVQSPAAQQAAAVAIPSPALEAAEAVAMAVEASDAAPVHVETIPVRASEALAVAESPEVAIAAAPTEPQFIAAPAQVAAPDSLATPAAADAIAAFQPTVAPHTPAANEIVEPVAAPGASDPEPAEAAIAGEVQAEVAAPDQAESMATEDDASNRAQQLRGLFDTARVAPEGNQPVAGSEYDVDGTSRSG